MEGGIHVALGHEVRVRVVSTVVPSNVTATTASPWESELGLRNTELGQKVLIEAGRRTSIEFSESLVPSLGDNSSCRELMAGVGDIHSHAYSPTT